MLVAGRHHLSFLSSRSFQFRRIPAYFRVTKTSPELPSSGRACRRLNNASCQQGDVIRETRQNGEHEPRSAYLHLPFCKRRCFYCDFPVQAIGPDPLAIPVQNTMQQYVDVLCREIEATEHRGANGLRTLFFGGGTPSLIPPKLLSQILECLRTRIGICEGAEISMEADPGTFTADSLEQYMSLGVNRFSIGIQAFQQDVLEHCGRSHNLTDVYQALEDVHKAGASNWSLDLISGLPYCSLSDWQHSLDEALKAHPPHISVYDLQVEDKTKFGRLYSPGHFPLPTDDNSAAMFCTASEVLQLGGLEHYEISSYATPGHRCKHNQVYWSGEPYHAFGLGAASYIKRRRFSRPRSMNAYKAWVQDLGGIGNKPSEGEDLQQEEMEMDMLLDMVMLRLRLKDGLELGDVKRKFGPSYAAAILDAVKVHIANNRVQYDKDTIALVDPQGFLFSNDIISDIFARLDPN